MKVKISGTEYDLSLGFQKASLQTLYVLAKDYGVSVKDLEAAGARFEGKDLVEIVSDPELLHALMAMIWMARRHSGEDVTLEESSSFPIADLEPVYIEYTEAAGEADPKEQTGSEADAAAPAARATSSSKTSKRRSTKTSPK